MRTFRYNQPVNPPVDGLDNLVCEITDEQIIIEFFDWWAGEMIKVGKADEISLEACVDDWVTVNWAWEVKNERTGN